MMKNKYKKLMIIKYFAILFITNSVVAQSPNILFIIADDLGTDVSKGYFTNSLMANTPTLDSLRSIGITFKNAWAYPVCTPTRASIMSGKYGVKTGILRAPGNLDTAHTSVFNQLKKQPINPYTGAVIGKWHISHPANPLHPIEHGADYYMGLLDAFPADYYVWDKTYNGATTVDSSYITSTLTDSAISWVGRQSQNWFLWLAHPAPHSPFHEPPSHMFTMSPTGNNYRKFLAMIESVDYEINRLLSSLDSAVRANTLVVFIGDNGTSSQLIQNYPSGRGKGTIYQGGVRVPMIVAGKGVTRQGVSDTSLINVLDIHSTVIELAGNSLPGGLNNSLSFKHLLDGSAGETRDYDYTEISDGSTNQGYTIRDWRYKLIVFDSVPNEFYDLKLDSLENNDLLLGVLSSQEQLAKTDLESEALQIRTAWSCRDHIQNGDEVAIDCGGTYCSPCVTSLQEDRKEFSFSLYPNPSSDKVYLKTNKNAKHNFEVKIYDVAGKLQLESTMIPNSSISVRNLTKGMYVMKVTYNQLTSSSILIKN
jgi:arylsulfatase A-like enzyme